ncbi:unnamed protein product [Allacma fusca]|uniref:SHSP domain-containing protein n=1 Tax=Allacma fusca TaxID=39272 RepID=A0A8J2JMN9_9HEXA|nr:unnamed protein product [Allacma fusca]
MKIEKCYYNFANMSKEGAALSQGGSFDPTTFGLTCLAELLNRNRAGLNGETLFQQCGSLVSEGILEYVRQLSTGTQPIKPVESSPGTCLETFSNFTANIQITTKDGKFIVTIPLGADVKPEDLKVVIKDRDLMIDVKTEMKSEDGKTRLYQEFSKSISLPEEVKTDQLKTVLSPEGILKVEATLSNEKPQSVEIPVKRFKMDSN